MKVTIYEGQFDFVRVWLCVRLEGSESLIMYGWILDYVFQRVLTNRQITVAFAG